jgi:beta-xylosidase
MRNILKNNMACRLLVLISLLFAIPFSVLAWQSDNGDGTFQNPPLYADYPDPSIIRVGHDFYFASTSFVQSPGLPVLKSQDLVNWEIVGHVVSSFDLNDSYNMIGGTAYRQGVFAPSLRYRDGIFYVVVTLSGQRTRIYYTRDVTGLWNYHQLNGSYFDPALFFDDDGTPYLAYGGAWQNQIRMIQLNYDCSAEVHEQQILAHNNVEGSKLIKRNGTYYLFNAVPANRLLCSRASNIWGPYGETVTLCNAGNGGHQGAIVDMPDGSDWGFIMQDDGSIGRMTRICPITWENGWPRFGRPGHLGQVESSYTKPIQNQSIKVPAASDEFNGSSLGLQWMWNHNPDHSKWSLTGSALRLTPSVASDFLNARNTLTQKGQGPKSNGSIKIDAGAMQSGDIGGLGMLGDPAAYIAVAMNPKRIIMSYEDNVQATVSGITADILYFRVEMNFDSNQARFFWKDDSRDWEQAGPSVTMGFDWQYGTFQGEQYAVFCFNSEDSHGYMDVDWFRLDDPAAPPIPGSGENVLEIEMESVSGQYNFSPLSVEYDGNASGGRYVVWPNDGSNQYNNSASDSATGQAAYTFTLSETASVEFEIVADFANGNDDSFYYKMDSGPWNTQNNVSTSGWEIIGVTVFNDLSAGSHTLTIERREDGAKMDKIILTATSGSLLSE